jgi:uncharacterized protein
MIGGNASNETLSMPYLIDGHNLIGQLPDISLDDPFDEAQLVQKLSGFVARAKQKCVVIFDHGLPGGASRMGNKSVKVIFASSPSNADQLIMKRIRNERSPSSWTVVSSDNEVLNMARRHKMRAVRASDFIQLLRRPTPPPQPDVGEVADVQLSPSEIEQWLAEFGADEQ